MSQQTSPELYIQVDSPNVGDLVMLLSPWGQDTGMIRVVLAVKDHALAGGTINRFLKLNDDISDWPVSYVRIISKAGEKDNAK